MDLWSLRKEGVGDKDLRIILVGMVGYGVVTNTQLQITKVYFSKSRLEQVFCVILTRTLGWGRLCLRKYSHNPFVTEEKMWRITSCLLNFHTEVTPVTSWILLAKQATWSYLISKKQQVHPTICLGSRHPEYWLLSTDDCHRNHCH